MSSDPPLWWKLKGLHVDNAKDARFGVEEVLSEMETFVKHARDSVTGSSSDSGSVGKGKADIQQICVTTLILMKHVHSFKQYSNHLFRHLNNHLGKCWKDCGSIGGNNSLEKATRFSRELYCSIYVIRQRFMEFLRLLSQTPGGRAQEESFEEKSGSSYTRRMGNTLKNETMKMIRDYIETTIPTLTLRVCSALKSCFKMYIAKVKRYNDFHQCWSDGDTQQLMNEVQGKIQGNNECEQCHELLLRVLVSCLVSAYLESTLFDKICWHKSTEQDKENVNIDEHMVNYDILSILSVLTDNCKTSIYESILIDKRPIFKADLVLKAIVTDISQFSSMDQSMIKSLLSFDLRNKLVEERGRREKPSGGRCLPIGFLGLGKGSGREGKVEVALPSYYLPLNSSRSLEIDVIAESDGSSSSRPHQPDDYKDLKIKGNRKSRTL